MANFNAEVHMDESGRCRNNNHSRMNVSVRFCPDCGEVVGKHVGTKSCQADAHAKKRKERNKFCVDCGRSLANA